MYDTEDPARANGKRRELGAGKKMARSEIQYTAERTSLVVALANSTFVALRYEKEKGGFDLYLSLRDSQFDGLEAKRKDIPSRSRCPRAWPFRAWCSQIRCAVWTGRLVARGSQAGFLGQRWKM
jgi:hypothetical protein